MHFFLFHFQEIFSIMKRICIYLILKTTRHVYLENINISCSISAQNCLYVYYLGLILLQAAYVFNIVVWHTFRFLDILYSLPLINCGKYTNKKYERKHIKLTYSFNVGNKFHH